MLSESSIDLLTPNTLPVLVGREREWTRLLELAGRLAEGEGTVAHLVGERGLGKSVLKDQLGLELRTRGVCVVELRCAPGAAPLGVLGDLLDHALLTHSMAEVAARCGWTPAQQAQLEGMRGANDSEDVDRSTLLDALVRLVLDPAEPRAIVFEEFRHARPIVREVLEQVADRIRDRPVLVMVLERPGTAVSQRRPGWFVMRLGRLSDDASRELVGSRLDLEPLPEATVRQLVETIGGNPYFLEQILDTWLEEGVLERGEGGFHFRRTDMALRLPDSLDAVLEERIGRLPLDERQLLRLMAVAGPSDPVVLAAAGAALFDWESDSFLDALNGLTRHRLIDQGKRQVSVPDAMLADAAARGMDSDVRVAAHAAIANALEAHGGATAERLAAHWEQGGSPEQALPHLVSAARKRRLAFDSDGAERLYRRALDILRDSALPVGLHPEIWEQLGDVYLARGDYQAAREAFDAALAGGTGQPRARWVRKRAQVAMLSGDSAAALAASAEAAACVDADDHAEEARIAGLIGATHLRRSELVLARAALERGNRSADQLTELGLRARVEAELSEVIGQYFLRGAKPHQALVVSSHGLRHTEAVDARSVRPGILRTMGLTLLALGRPLLAAHHVSRALEEAAAIEDLAGQARAHAALVELALARGDTDAAMGEAMAGLALGGAVEDPVLAAELGLAYARTELARGDLASAEAELGNAAQLAGLSGAPVLELSAQLLEAELAARTGNPRLARPVVDGVLVRAEALGEVALVGRARVLLGRVLGQLDRREEAISVLLDVLDGLEPARRQLRAAALGAVRELRDAGRAAAAG